MIKVTAVRRKNLGSRIIQWGLGEPASHLILYFPRLGNIMHFTGRRFHLQADYILDHYYEVASVFLDVGTKECQIARWMIDALTGTEYDMHGFLFFAKAAFRRKFFDQPLPKRNAYQRDSQMLCTEILYPFLDAWAEIIGQSIPLAYDFAIVSPLDCVRLLKETLCPRLYTPSPWPWPLLPRPAVTDTSIPSR